MVVFYCRQEHKNKSHLLGFVTWLGQFFVLIPLTVTRYSLSKFKPLSSTRAHQAISQ